MTFLPQASSVTESTSAETPASQRYVARQPILDAHGHMHGYELLFRSGPETLFRGDGDLATRTMLDNILLFGMEKLTGGLPAFINCTADSLTERLVDVLPTEIAVLEILENIEPTPQIIATCKHLKAAGFRLALDDFVWKPRFQPLLEIADYVKIDFLATSHWERRNLLEKLEGLTPILLAEKVETQENFKQACDEGFTLFQGYYFCRPTLIKSHKIPANRLSHFAILKMLQAVDIDLRELSERLKQDASLTYRLLRLVNSPLYGMRQEVTSIDTALLVIGEDTFRRVAMLAITSELGANPPLELLRMAFVRGRFCEAGATLLALDATEQYLLGLLSLVPAMLRTPIDVLTPALPLREEVKQALEGQRNRERALLGWIENNEKGDWDACDLVAGKYGLAPDVLLKNFAEAVLWAEAALSASA